MWDGTLTCFSTCLATASSTAHRQFGTSDFWMRGREADLRLTSHEQVYMLELAYNFIT